MYSEPHLSATSTVRAWSQCRREGCRYRSRSTCPVKANKPIIHVSRKAVAASCAEHNSIFGAQDRPLKCLAQQLVSLLRVFRQGCSHDQLKNPATVGRWPEANTNNNQSIEINQTKMTHRRVVRSADKYWALAGQYGCRRDQETANCSF